MAAIGKLVDALAPPQNAVRPSGSARLLACVVDVCVEVKLVGREECYVTFGIVLKIARLM